MPLSPTLFSALLASASIRLKMPLQYRLPRREGLEMRFATFTMSDDPRKRVGVCTPDGTSLIDIAQVSEDAGRPRWGDLASLIAAAADGLPAWLRTLASDNSARALPLAEVRLRTRGRFNSPTATTIALCA